MILQTKQLKRAVRILAPLFSGRRIVPATEYICIKDGFAHATNLNTYMSVVVDRFEEPFMLPYDELSRILTLTTDDTIELIGSVLKTSSASHNLGSLPNPADFPSIEPLLPFKECMEVNESFFSSIKKAARFVYKWDGRPEITGVGLGIGEILQVAAINNHIVYRENVEIISQKKKTISLQPDAQSFLGDFKNASIRINDKQMHIFGDGITCILPLKETTFPNFNLIFPEVIEWNVVVEKDDLQQALNECLVSKDDAHVVDIIASKEGLLLKHTNGEQHDEASCKADVVYPTTQRFLAQNFLKILSSIDSLSIEISFNLSKDKAAYIRPERDENLIFLLQPIS